MLLEEQEFLKKLYQKDFDLIIRYIANMLHIKGISPEQISVLAEDLAQDTFHTASEKIRTVMSHPNPTAWLVVTARHKFQEYTRRANTESRWFVPSNELLENLPDPQHNPSSVLEEMGYTDTMEKIRQALSDEEFRLFSMMILNHASHKDASKELGITVWTSQKRLARIRDKLQELFFP